MKKMELIVQRLLSYRVVFPNGNDNIEDLLASVPSNSAIEFVSYQLAKKVNQFVGDHDVSIWAPWVMKTKNDVKNPIGHYAEQYNLGQFALIDRYAMLLLISKLLTCYNGCNAELTQDDYSNLLLAYMLCCDERLETNMDLPYNSMSADEFVKNFMPVCLKSDDIEAPRDYRLLMIKCYMLLIEFPKCNAHFAHYVDEFCKEKGIPNAKHYLDELFLAFLNISSLDISNCLMEVSDECQSTCHYFDGMSIDPSNYEHDGDFLMMKEKPILKTGQYRYNFMYMNMFLDKAYNGLLFDIKDALVRRGLLDATKGYGNLRAFLGENFSEHFFFYTLMNRCFGQRYVNYSGADLEKTLGEGMPDYYMRRGNRIFLFECKDVQVASRIKLSGDYETIQNAIYEKFVSNTKGHAKGVGQLANVIKEKLSSILNNIDESAPKGVKYVFPIIVYSDNCFDVEGPNYLLNKEFRKIINDGLQPGDYIVKDIVMVNMEQFMRLENYFVADKLKLSSLINSYLDYKTHSELNQVFPFNKFLIQEATKKGYTFKKTKWFEEVHNNLVAMDNDSHISAS